MLGKHQGMMMMNCFCVRLTNKRPFCQPGSLPEILTIANVWHVTSRIWTCAEHEFIWSCICSFWSVKYLNFQQKPQIQTAHHTFLECRQPGWMSLKKFYPPQGARKRYQLISNGLLVTVIVNFVYQWAQELLSGHNNDHNNDHKIMSDWFIFWEHFSDWWFNFIMVMWLYCFWK